MCIPISFPKLVPRVSALAAIGAAISMRATPFIAAIGFATAASATALPATAPTGGAGPLLRFAFLLGHWACDVDLKGADRRLGRLHATWTGHFILDRHAIEDEYKMTSESGEVVVVGTNYRVYDRAKRLWNLRWLNALSGEWTDLAPPEFGGPEFTDHTARYFFRSEPGRQAFTRATYTIKSKSNFTWLGEDSTNAKDWVRFMLIDCKKVYR